MEAKERLMVDAGAYLEFGSYRFLLSFIIPVQLPITPSHHGIMVSHKLHHTTKSNPKRSITLAIFGGNLLIFGYPK